MNHGSAGDAISQPSQTAPEHEAEPNAAPPRSPSRIAGPEDWDDPAWSRFVADPRLQNAAAWERTQLLFGLECCGRLSLSARILVAAAIPDPIIGLLSEYVGRVDVLDLRRQSERRGSEARLFWTGDALYARDRVHVLERLTGFEGLRGANYDAVVFPHSALFYAGTLGIARLLAGAEGALAFGGLVAFKADILTGTEPSPEHLDFAMLGADGLAAQIECATGYVVVGGEPRLSPRMAAALEPGNSSRAAAGDLVREHRGRLAIPSVWLLRKNRETTRAEWQCIDRWLVAPLLGEQLDRLELGPAGRRDGRRIVVVGGASGNVFFGPYLALPEGRYEAIFAIEPAGSRRCSLLLDVAAEGTTLNRRSLKFGEAAGTRVTLPFTVSAPQSDAIAKIEIRAWRNRGEAAFSACLLQGGLTAVNRLP